ncbi:hypothetical protein D3C80_1707410 [compost metagenome]
MAALTRIQSGFLSFSAGTILMGMRAVLSADFCLRVGSYASAGDCGASLEVAIRASLIHFSARAQRAFRF